MINIRVKSKQKGKYIMNKIKHVVYHITSIKQDSNPKGAGDIIKTNASTVENKTNADAIYEDNKRNFHMGILGGAFVLLIGDAIPSLLMYFGASEIIAIVIKIVFGVPGVIVALRFDKR